MPSKSFEEAVRLEDNVPHHPPLDRTRTAGGHLDDRSQPSLPVVHRRFANPAPLGVLSLATSLFLISTFGFKVRGVTAPNIMVGCLIVFGGACQFISGIMEFVSGNTFGATVFPSYGALNIAYGMIYIPGTGILGAYVDAKTGKLDASFPQAVSIFLWAWFILSVAFTVAATRSSWVLLFDFVAVDLLFLFLACGYMTGNEGLLKTGYCFGYVAVVLSYWAGVAGLWAGGVTAFEVPVFPLYKQGEFGH